MNTMDWKIDRFLGDILYEKDRLCEACNTLIALYISWFLYSKKNQIPLKSCHNISLDRVLVIFMCVHALYCLWEGK